MINNTNRSRNIKTPICAFLLVLCAAAGAQTTNPDRFRHVDSTAVWHPPANFRQTLDMDCGRLGGAAFRDCFIALMKKLGASPEALRFTSMTDTTGFVRDFINTGKVDIAFVAYPFRANENFGVTLVNGNPPMIDVDDFQFVDLKALKKDTTYDDLVLNYPDASIWPGDRFHTDMPRPISLPEGGQRFILKYNIKNGCHACEDIGTAEFAFDFTNDGTFIGTKLIKVTTLPR